MERDDALELVREKVSNPNIVKHMLAAEAAMRAVARRLGEDEEVWALAGLLHDLDYDLTKDEPARHGPTTLEMLSDVDLPAGVADAILAHNKRKEAETPLEKALLAVDPTTGLVVAAALVAASAGPAAADVRIEGASFAAVPYIRDDGRVEDARFRTLGYLRDDGRVEDARFRTVGYVRGDGTIEDASFRTVGYVRSGVVQDATFRAVGFFKGELDGDVDAAVGAYFFFFSAALFPQAGWDTVYEP